LLCPNENSEMQPVKVESHYGQPVILDQCQVCGGIWFDRLELYSVKQGQAQNLEALDIEKLRAPSLIEKSELICPRDHARLIQFVDPYFPREIIIVRCPLCDGLWLNRGQFTKYQNFRQERINHRDQTTADVKLGKDVEYILEQSKTGSVEDSLGTLGKFLSTPLDPNTWRPLEPEKLTEKEEISLNLILNALTVILRYFIKF
jgi:Zn-finger nucleic acid-binding protein